MPMYGGGGKFILRFHWCRNWKTLADLLPVLERLQDDVGATAVYSDYFDDGNTISTRAIPRSDFAEYYTVRHFQRHDWDDPDLITNAQTALRIWLRPSFMPGTHAMVPLRDDLLIHVYAKRFGRVSNELELNTTLRSRMDLHTTMILPYADQVMEEYTRVARLVIQALAPAYVWMAEDDEYVEHRRGHDILNHHVDTIYWANYFARDYLTPDMTQLFVTAPVGHVESFAGGLWYQLHEQFESVDLEEVEYIEGAVMQHFRQMKLDRVQWKFQFS